MVMGSTKGKECTSERIIGMELRVVYEESMVSDIGRACLRDIGYNNNI